MKVTVQSGGDHAQQATGESGRTRQSPSALAHGEGLARIAASVDSSPRAQVLAQLKGAIRQSSRVQGMMDLAAAINNHAPAQLRGVPVSDDPALEHEAGVRGTEATAQSMPADQIRGHKSIATAHAGGNEIAQRVSINLQPADNVIKKLLKYANEKLGVNDQLFDSVEAAQGRVLGKTENIYLFGHGGYSGVEIEEHDLFAGINMGNLATNLHDNITFPEEYTGTIFLIGCKTDSLLSSLKSQLDTKTGKNLNIRGTTETLQTGKDGEIGLRDQPGTEAEVRRREIADIQRYFYQPLITLRNSRREVLNELGRADDFEKKKAAISIAFAQRKIVDSRLDAIRTGLERLKGTTSPKLLGKKSGLQSIEEVYAKSKEAQNKIQQCLVQFLDLHEKKPLPQNGPQLEAEIIQKLTTVLSEDRRYLTEQIDVTALLVGINDEPDMLLTQAFSLEQMVDVTGAREVKNLKNARIGFNAVTEQIQGWTQTALKRTLLWKEINAELTDPQQNWSNDEVANRMKARINKLSTYLAVLHRIQVAQNSPDQLYESANQATRRKLDLDPDFTKKRSTFNSLLEHEKPESFIGAALDLCDQMHDITNRLMVEAATETSSELGSGLFGLF